MVEGREISQHDGAATSSLGAPPSYDGYGSYEDVDDFAESQDCDQVATSVQGRVSLLILLNSALLESQSVS